VSIHSGRTDILLLINGAGMTLSDMSGEQSRGWEGRRGAYFPWPMLRRQSRRGHLYIDAH
jgi:hypothetical protein